MPNKKDIKFPERTKPSRGDMKPDSVPETPAAPPPPAAFEIHPFPDGTPFRMTVNPARPGTFLVFDARRIPVAVVNSPGCAEFICTAAAHFIFAKAQAEQARAAEAQNLTDAIVAVGDGPIKGTVQQATPENVTQLNPTNEHS